MPDPHTNSNKEDALNETLQQTEQHQDGKSGGQGTSANNTTKPTKKNSHKNIEQLEQKLADLSNKLIETEEIARKAQSDYIHIKFDFDSYMTRNEQAAKTAKIDSLIEVVKKFLPFIDSLRQSLDNIPAEEQDDSIVQGVQLVYKKFLSTLEQMNIYKTESIGLSPDIEFHEAISTLPVEDTSQKGKIIQEFEQGFYYEKGDIKKVVTPAKVIIGQ